MDFLPINSTKFNLPWPHKGSHLFLAPFPSCQEFHVEFHELFIDTSSNVAVVSHYPTTGRQIAHTPSTDASSSIEMTIAHTPSTDSSSTMGVTVTSESMAYLSGPAKTSFEETGLLVSKTSLKNGHSQTFLTFLVDVMVKEEFPSQLATFLLQLLPNRDYKVIVLFIVTVKNTISHICCLWIICTILPRLWVLPP